MGDAEQGTCSVCKKESNGISRKYFRYEVKCECCSPTHFEIVYHCTNCVPKEPILTNITIKTENLNTIE